jgi:formamidopyrimidine-DNA glycosylase
MPELPEVEVLVRHLRQTLPGRRIQGIEVLRAKLVRPTTAAGLRRRLVGARFVSVARRGKYILFELNVASAGSGPGPLVGHLGMTGRMFLQPRARPLPKHAVVVFRLDRDRLVFEDTRGFGRLSFDASRLARLGPEPLSDAFSGAVLWRGLQRSRQAIKVRLLDQKLVAGVGNIYASESLFRARLSPRRAACRVRRDEADRLCAAIRETLSEAIEFGSTVPLDWDGTAGDDGLFYYGKLDDGGAGYDERLLVYDRAGEPCPRCSTPIRRIVQAARSAFYCPCCQR